jgi:hypothetical protein
MRIQQIKDENQMGDWSDGRTEIEIEVLPDGRIFVEIADVDDYAQITMPATDWWALIQQVRDTASERMP